MTRLLLLAAASTLALAACNTSAPGDGVAEMSPASKSDGRERVVVTGSRIPGSQDAAASVFAFETPPPPVMGRSGVAPMSPANHWFPICASMLKRFLSALKVRWVAMRKGRRFLARSLGKELTRRAVSEGRGPRDQISSPPAPAIR